MRHDPDLPSSPAGSGTRGWLRTIFARSDDPAPEPIEPAEAPDLATLAAELSGLIASARSRLDGAVAVVDRSVAEAADYGRALSAGAAAIDRQLLPNDAVQALLEVTRAMIEQTESAEARLRATNGELRTLQHELSVAQESAERDPLTGLLNRRALGQALVRAVEAARRTDAALSVAFCDIDQFKRLNDVHGHAVGDRVLRLVGDCLAQAADKHTFVGRQGGEEFVVLFEGLPVIEAAARIDAVREALADRVLRSRSDGTPIGRVTFSAGVAALAHDETGDALLARADQALYRAKEGGRNQVVIDPGS